MTFKEVIETKLVRVRLPIWANKTDYIKLHWSKEGYYGPWVKLFSPVNKVIGQVNPQPIMTFRMLEGTDSEATWEEYTGPIDPDEEVQP